MVLPIARYSRLPGVSGNEAGALKLTIEKFYRIAGGSTQLRGVSADITLPSIYDRDEFGVSALKGPMPYDVIDAAPFEKVADRPLFIAELRQHSVARVAADTELLHVQEDLDLIKQHGYVLTPGRYVGAEEIEDDGEPFEEKMSRLVAELSDQFDESAKLEKAIAENLKGLGYAVTKQGK